MGFDKLFKGMTVKKVAYAKFWRDPAINSFGR